MLVIAVTVLVALEKASDTHISPNLFICISVFLVACMIGCSLVFKVYAMLEFLVEYSHPENHPLLGKCLAILGYCQNCRRFCICLVGYKIYKTLKTNNLNAPLGGLAWNGG